jgi:hypothetical protein
MPRPSILQRLLAWFHRDSADRDRERMQDSRFGQVARELKKSIPADADFGPFNPPKPRRD